MKISWSFGAISVAAIGASVAFAFVGCGSEEDAGTNPNDTADSGTAKEEAGACLQIDNACVNDGDCCSGACEPTSKKCARIAGKCTASGDACQIGPDCCTFACIKGNCSDKQCIADGAACTDNGECCGGTCEGGTCKALNTTCKTSGNPCGGNGECCSQYCKSGICSGPSFCTQNGDACASDVECCGGVCTKSGGATLGTCGTVDAPGTTGCLGAGQVCSGGAVYDGGAGIPECGGECCSRSCFPHSATGVFVCQNPSGCKPTGELCKDDKDCCGSETLPDGPTSKVTCSKTAGAALGRCTNGNACTPAGAICRLQTNECNANANCCAGNVLQKDTCKQDSLGIPRCLIAEIDCTNPSSFTGKACASSADCCGLPCTPDSTGKLVCGGACIPTGGGCTTTADCCAGIACNIPPGSTVGTCGGSTTTPPPPPSGTDASTPPPTTPPCSAYGQQCSEQNPCCNNVPCTNGYCITDVR